MKGLLSHGRSFVWHLLTENGRGVAVGSRDDYDNLNRFLEERNVSLKPLIDDRVFDFEDSQAAFDYLWSGKHVGKVVIRI